MEQIIAAVRELDGSLVLLPGPGDGSPEIAWGDAFFYYAPDGQVPTRTQPFGTIVTKDHPGDEASALDAPGRWRVNVRIDRATFCSLIGEDPRSISRAHDHAAVDRIVPHPVYGALGWIAVVNPGERTANTVVRLLRAAHEAARARFARRGGPDLA
ncbi:DUF6194 family protein [Streptomyces sp. NPDC058877]|uniref:DUF6194 family protein n=1 Tax=unclassified Streptomyces TaxID=2593676 RepID=UPI0036BE43C4